MQNLKREKFKKVYRALFKNKETSYSTKRETEIMSHKKRLKSLARKTEFPEDKLRG